MGKTLVVAIGGNSLIKDPQHMSVPDQYRALGETSGHIAAIIRDGWHVAIGHGNGPQVGFILRRSELASHELHEVPLDVCDADTPGRDRLRAPAEPGQRLPPDAASTARRSPS